MLKGLLPMLAAGWLLRRGRVEPLNHHEYIIWLGVGFATIIGHMFSIFIGFKGGKGVATSCGVLLGLWPYYTLPGIVAVAIWIASFMIWRYISLASIIGSLAFPLAYAGIGSAMKWDVLGEQHPLLIFAVIVAALIVYKHRSNITRLRAGTENRAGSIRPT